MACINLLVTYIYFLLDVRYQKNVRNERLSLQATALNCRGTFYYTLLVKLYPDSEGSFFRPRVGELSSFVFLRY